MVRDCIENTDPEILAEYWAKDEGRLKSLEKSELFEIWVSEVDKELRIKHSGKDIPDPKRMISDNLSISECMSVIQKKQ
ncbi:hypothetical protein [Candidatus Sororendozoicomonas aggregata]|uniref:hypothetical protein n=1 Tax=Candidatus Sororendozoicomonas aggregata TaxID=3073239 RepID=UPI002ED54776